MVEELTNTPGIKSYAEIRHKPDENLGVLFGDIKRGLVGGEVQLDLTAAELKTLFPKVDDWMRTHGKGLGLDVTDADMKFSSQDGEPQAELLMKVKKRFARVTVRAKIKNSQTPGEIEVTDAQAGIFSGEANDAMGGIKLGDHLRTFFKEGIGNEPGDVKIGFELTADEKLRIRFAKSSQAEVTPPPLPASEAVPEPLISTVLPVVEETQPAKEATEGEESVAPGSLREGAVAYELVHAKHESKFDNYVLYYVVNGELKSEIVVPGEELKPFLGPSFTNTLVKDRDDLKDEEVRRLLIANELKGTYRGGDVERDIKVVRRNGRIEIIETGDFIKASELIPAEGGVTSGGPATEAAPAPKETPQEEQIEPGYTKEYKIVRKDGGDVSYMQAVWNGEEILVWLIDKDGVPTKATNYPVKDSDAARYYFQEEFLKGGDDFEISLTDTVPKPPEQAESGTRGKLPVTPEVTEDQLAQKLYEEKLQRLQDDLNSLPPPEPDSADEYGRASDALKKVKDAGPQAFLTEARRRLAEESAKAKETPEEPKPQGPSLNEEMKRYKDAKARRGDLAKIESTALDPGGRFLNDEESAEVKRLDDETKRIEELFEERFGVLGEGLFFRTYGDLTIETQDDQELDRAHHQLVSLKDGLVTLAKRYFSGEASEKEVEDWYVGTTNQITGMGKEIKLDKDKFLSEFKSGGISTTEPEIEIKVGPTEPEVIPVLPTEPPKPKERERPLVKARDLRPGATWYELIHWKLPPESDAKTKEGYYLWHYDKNTKVLTGEHTDENGTNIDKDEIANVAGVGITRAKTLVAKNIESAQSTGYSFDRDVKLYEEKRTPEELAFELLKEVPEKTSEAGETVKNYLERLAHSQENFREAIAEYRLAKRKVKEQIPVRRTVYGPTLEAKEKNYERFLDAALHDYEYEKDLRDLSRYMETELAGENLSEDNSEYQQFKQLGMDAIAVYQEGSKKESPGEIANYLEKYADIVDRRVGLFKKIKGIEDSETKVKPQDVEYRPVAIGKPLGVTARPGRTPRVLQHPARIARLVTPVQPLVRFESPATVMPKAVPGGFGQIPERPPERQPQEQSERPQKTPVEFFLEKRPEYRKVVKRNEGGGRVTYTFYNINRNKEGGGLRIFNFTLHEDGKYEQNKPILVADPSGLENELRQRLDEDKSQHNWEGYEYDVDFTPELEEKLRSAKLSEQPELRMSRGPSERREERSGDRTEEEPVFKSIEYYLKEEDPAMRKVVKETKMYKGREQVNYTFFRFRKVKRDGKEQMELYSFTLLDKGDPERNRKPKVMNHHTQRNMEVTDNLEQILKGQLDNLKMQQGWTGYEILEGVPDELKTILQDPDNIEVIKPKKRERQPA